MLNWPSHPTIQLLPPVSVINTQQKHDHKPLPWSRVTGKKPGKKLLEVVFVVCTMFWPLCTLLCYLLPREASIAYSCHMWVGLHNSLTHSLAAPTPDLPNFREQNKRTNSIYMEQPTQITIQWLRFNPTSTYIRRGLPMSALQKGPRLPSWKGLSNALNPLASM